MSCWVGGTVKEGWGQRCQLFLNKSGDVPNVPHGNFFCQKRLLTNLAPLGVFADFTGILETDMTVSVSHSSEVPVVSEH